MESGADYLSSAEPYQPGVLVSFIEQPIKTQCSVLYQCNFFLYNLLECDALCAIIFCFCGRKYMRANQQRPTCPQTCWFCLIRCDLLYHQCLNKLLWSCYNLYAFPPGTGHVPTRSSMVSVSSYLMETHMKAALRYLHASSALYPSQNIKTHSKLPSMDLKTVSCVLTNYFFFFAFV